MTGLMIVPAEPTSDMLVEGQEAWVFKKPGCVEDCEEAEAVYRAMVASAPSPWQPIETAPRDGKPIMLFARARLARASLIIVGWHLQDRGWVECSFTAPVGVVPSHWMPLPSPPAGG